MQQNKIKSTWNESCWKEFVRSCNQNIFSVIIPTLWKSKRIHKLIKDLSSCKNVGEIILIDNNNKFKQYYPEGVLKVKVISKKENIFVGPAWNLGVEKAKYENIALVNDDINFDNIIFEKIMPYINQGIIGMAKENYNNKNLNGEIGIEVFSNGIGPPIYVRPGGWGCFILFKKYIWKKIPEEIKIWYTDDWIVFYNPAKKYCLFNFLIETEMSTTSDGAEFGNVKHLDMLYFDKLNSEWSKNKNFDGYLS